MSAGLDYPGVGPELAQWKDSERAKYIAATDAEAFIGFRLASQLEGIIPALETAHAIYGAIELAKTMNKDQDIVICVSGRGDKDVQSVAEELPKLGPKIGWDLRCKSCQYNDMLHTDKTQFKLPQTPYGRLARQLTSTTLYMTTFRQAYLRN